MKCPYHKRFLQYQCISVYVLLMYRWMGGIRFTVGALQQIVLSKTHQARIAILPQGQAKPLLQDPSHDNGKQFFAANSIAAAVPGHHCAVLPQDQAEPLLQGPSVNDGKPFSAARCVAAAVLVMAGSVCGVVIQIKSAAL